MKIEGKENNTNRILPMTRVWKPYGIHRKNIPSWYLTCARKYYINKIIYTALVYLTGSPNKLEYSWERIRAKSNKSKASKGDFMILSFLSRQCLCNIKIFTIAEPAHIILHPVPFESRVVKNARGIQLIRNDLARERNRGWGNLRTRVNIGRQFLNGQHGERRGRAREGARCEDR